MVYYHLNIIIVWGIELVFSLLLPLIPSLTTFWKVGIVFVNIATINPIIEILDSQGDSTCEYCYYH